MSAAIAVPHSLLVAACDDALARHDFSPFVVSESSSSWDAEPYEAGSTRFLTVVRGYVPDTDAAGNASATDAEPEVLQAQFNVLFADGSATPSDVYAGDWHRAA